jgi:hypothetical protein
MNGCPAAACKTAQLFGTVLQERKIDAAFAADANAAMQKNGAMRAPLRKCERI